MVVTDIREDPIHEHDSDTESQVTDDPALKDTSGRSTEDSSSQSSSEEASKFVRKESRHVLYLRVIVLLLLFSASAAICLVVFFVTMNGEMDTFESQYYAAADKVTGKSNHCVAARVELPFLAGHSSMACSMISRSTIAIGLIAVLCSLSCETLFVAVAGTSCEISSASLGVIL